jgi:CheY-like chemotaxis protein
VPLKIAHLRAQHEQILLVVARIEGLVDQHNVLTDAPWIRHAVSVLASHLRLHLETEDRHLYPAMMGSAEPRARDMAKHMHEEMGGLQAAFDAYHEQWTEENIRRQGVEFSAATKAVITALRRRIARENEDLYPFANDILLSADPGSATVPGEVPLVFIVDAQEAEYLLISESWKESSLQATFEYMASGAELLKRLATPPAPHLIIINLVLPNTDVLQLTSQVRRQSPARTLPIVLISSQTTTRESDLALRHGASGSFPKPTNFDEYLHFAHAMHDLINFNRSR